MVEEERVSDRVRQGQKRDNRDAFRHGRTRESF